MRKMTLILLVILLLISMVGGFIYGQKVHFSEQWPLFEALRTTSSIIFAVVGAWLAIVYPERLRLSIRNEKTSTSLKSINNIGTLLSPAVNSTVVLCVVLLVGIIAPIMKHTFLVSLYLNECRGITYALLVGLTLWQTWTVILTLLPADLILSQTEHENTKKRVFDGMRVTSISQNNSKDSSE